uniref:Putative secreted protein n=1 Tax=Anopheles triannulatus TaxID=58253 RepID=A0A2M4B0W7_9DIPT
MRARPVEAGRGSEGSATLLLLLLVQFFQIDRARIVGAIEPVHVERLAAVEGLVGASRFNRARVHQRYTAAPLRRRWWVDMVHYRHVDRGRVQWLGVTLLPMVMIVARQRLGAVVHGQPSVRGPVASWRCTTVRVLHRFLTVLAPIPCRQPVGTLTEATECHLAARQVLLLLLDHSCFPTSRCRSSSSLPKHRYRFFGHIGHIARRRRMVAVLFAAVVVASTVRILPEVVRLPGRQSTAAASIRCDTGAPCTVSPIIAAIEPPVVPLFRCGGHHLPVEGVVVLWCVQHHHRYRRTIVTDVAIDHVVLLVGGGGCIARLMTRLLPASIQR